MKKINDLNGNSKIPRMEKLFRIMKLTSFFLMISVVSVLAGKTYSQTALLNLNMGKTTVKEVLSKIEDQSEFYFMYSGKVIDANREVSFDVKDQKIDEVLNSLFAGTNVDYTIKDRIIVLTTPEVVSSKVLANFQQKSISGKVTDTNNQPLPGVTVVIKGSTQGTVTDGNGNFTISNVPDNATLHFSFVGMKAQDVLIGNQTTINVSMEEETIGLEEVVAIGYGTVRKIDVTGSASKINTDYIADLPMLRVDQMLQGKASGMLVTQVNGSPGAASSIRIRGNNSITASSEPLYVVDGLLGMGNLSTINPSDIEDITILKDASTTAIYGSQGANGVILITTKKGKIGPAQINFNVQQGTQWLPRKIPLLNGPEYAQLLNESRIAAGGQAVYPNPENVETTDWQDETIDTAPMTIVNATYNGGAGDFKYFISGNYFNQGGIMKNSSAQRLQIRTNLEGRFNNKIKVGFNLNAGTISTENNTVSMAPQWSLITTAPSMPVYNSDGSYNYNYPHPNFNGRFNTPVAQQNLITSESDRGNLMINSYVEYAPVEWITLKSTFGGQMLGFGGNYNYTDSDLPGQTTNNQYGRASMAYDKYTNFQNENTVSFVKLFDKNHFIEGVVGATFQGGFNEDEYASAYRFMSDANLWYNLSAGDPATRDIGSGYADWHMNSFLGRFTYKYKDRYLVTAVAREDGSSRLGEGYKWQFFPSVALGWIISEETFLKDVKNLSFLKLKASYGQVGNQSVGIYQTMSIITAYPTIVGNERVSGWLPGKVSGNTSLKGNPNLTWEVKDQLDIGFEANFFNGRLDFNVDYYNSKTRNLLLLTEIPYQTGYTQQMSNIGEVSNKGIDLKINSVNIKGSSFSWTTDLALSYNKNEVLKLGLTGADIITHTYTWGVRPIGILRVGEPVGSFYGYISDGIWKENQGSGSTMVGARAGSVRYKDVNEDGIIDVKDNVILGNGSPDLYGGIGNNFSYKGIGLNIFFSGATGAKIFNGNAPFLRSADPQTNQYREVLDRWHPLNNPYSNVPGALNTERETYPSDRWVFDASYIRLESVNLSYSLSLRENVKKYIKNATINLTGLNLFCLSPYNDWGYDPVINQPGGGDLGYVNSLRGFDYGAYPKAASFTIGINIGF